MKSFFASVECVERGLDPMKENLVVADPDRSDKTICLAITPAMKAQGIKNRCRMFEIPKDVKFIVAPPRMKLYIEYAAEIYAIYLKYISKDDMHVYSIDEVFIDVTNYLALYKKTPKEMAIMLMDDVFNSLGIRAACGIGTNLYLAKIALDITAKHSKDFIGYLDEELYKKTLWNHKPLTDFWRVGVGTKKRLETLGIYTMGDIARANEDALYKKFGIDAELLIDHANGIEPVTIKDIKNYKSKTNCLSRGQVLMHDYNFSDAELIVKEMTDLLCLDLVEKELVTKSVTLVVGYSNQAEKPSAKGTFSLASETNSNDVLRKEISKLYKNIVNKETPVRRITITFNNVVHENGRQISLFDSADTIGKNKELQSTMIKIKHKFGKNAAIKGMNLEENATTMERNRQIGGHKSGE
ncbi:MAG: DNA repair protein [Clostridia bacterium]|nr:DNA repair protein [Clostridia bacterium]